MQGTDHVAQELEVLTSSFYVMQLQEPALLAGGSLRMVLQAETVRAHLHLCSNADLLPVQSCIDLSPAKLAP